MREVMSKKKGAAPESPPRERGKKGQRERELNKRLRQIFDPVLDEPIPDSLIEILRNKGKQKPEPDK